MAKRRGREDEAETLEDEAEEPAAPRARPTIQAARAAEPDEDDETTRILSEIRRAGGGKKIKISVYRKSETGREQFVGSLPIAQSDVSSWDEIVARAFKGGDYHVKWHVDGAITTHSECSIDPRQFGELSSPDLDQAPLDDEPEGEPEDDRITMLEAQLEEMQRRERIRRKKRREKLLVRPLLREVRSLRDMIERAPQAPPVDPLEQVLKFRKATANDGAPSPEVVELRAKMEALQKELRDERQKRERDEKDELRATITTLGKKIDDLSEEDEDEDEDDDGDPLLEELTREVAQFKKLDLLMNMGKAPEDRNSAFFDGLMKRLEKKLGPQVIDAIEKKIVDTVESHAAGATTAGAGAQTNAQPQATNGAPTNGSPQAENVAEFVNWLSLQAKEDFAFCRNMGTIATIAAKYPTSFGKLEACRDRASFVELIASAGYPRAAIEANVTAEAWARAAERLNDMRATIAASKAAPRAQAQEPTKPAGQGGP